MTKALRSASELRRLEAELARVTKDLKKAAACFTKESRQGIAVVPGHPLPPARHVRRNRDESYGWFLSGFDAKIIATARDRQKWPVVVLLKSRRPIVDIPFGSRHHAPMSRFFLQRRWAA